MQESIWELHVTTNISKNHVIASKCDTQKAEPCGPGSLFFRFSGIIGPGIFTHLQQFVYIPIQQLMTKRRSYNLDNHAHFLTFTCYRRQYLLSSNEVRRELLRKWSSARDRLDIRIIAYVIMPNHVHLLIYPNQAEYRVSKILKQLKAPIARWAIHNWQAHNPKVLDKITAINSVRNVRIFWQVGGGYDRNITDSKTLRRAIEYIEFNPVRKGLVGKPEQ